MNYVMEFCGCLSSGSNGIAVNEIEAYDNQNNKCDITNIQGYDNVTWATPHYWNSGGWGKNSLIDGDTSYSSTTSTFFLYNKSNLQLTHIGRISFDTDDLCKAIKVYYGTSSNDRTPKVINLYKLKDEYKNESLNFYTVIKYFSKYIDYYDLIESVDTTDLERLQPITFGTVISQCSEVLKSKIIDKIKSHDLFYNIMPYDKKED